MAVLIGHGGKQVSAEIAAGRYLRSFIDVGDRLTAGEFDGTAIRLHPATVELERGDGAGIHAPYSRVLATGPTIRPQR